MRDNFEQALKAVLVHEGGYVNHPKDPGGATNKGITHRTYAAWLHQQGTGTKNVRDITDAEVAAIYKDQYWDAVRGDDLPSGLDYAMFDFAVNSGPSRSVKFTQAIVGAAQDGIVGNQTLLAIDTFEAKNVVSQLCDNRLAWLKRLKTWSTFGKGWERRVREVKAMGLRLAGAGYSHAAEASEAAQGRADGPITTTEAIKDALRDPKAVGGAIAVALPSAVTVAQGDGPVQWAIGAVMVIAALSAAFWLFRKKPSET